MSDCADIVRADDPSFREVAEALGLGMVFQVQVSADGSGRRFTYLSPNCEQLTGVTAEAALANGALLYERILLEHRLAFAEAERDAIASFIPFQMEVAFEHPDGGLRWVRIASSPRRLEDGSTLWDGLLADITESRRLSDALERQRGRLEVAVEATGLGLWEWNVRTDELSWSDRNRALFGLEPGAPVTVRTYLHHVHPDELEMVKQVYLDAKDARIDRDFSLEHRIILPNGDVRWILVHGRVVRDGAGPHAVVGTNLDVTERRAAEERRKLTLGELAHRQKNGLLIMLAMVRQAAEGAHSVEAMEAVLSARIHAMAGSQDLLTAAGGRAVRLGDLLDQLLPVFDAERFDVDPQVRDVYMPGETSVGLALLLHELGTNAVKHGALSSRQGRVRIFARSHASDREAVLEWRESGGPEVRPSGRRGFGSRLLEAALRDRGGRVEPSFARDGFAAVVQFRTSD